MYDTYHSELYNLRCWIHNSYINVIIPFNKNVMETMNQIGKNDGKNDGKNLINEELT